MGISITDYAFRVSGVLDTSKTVMQNIETLCSTASAWATYDIHTGKWAVVINEAGTSEYSFDDSNIIGAISVSGKGLTEQYNSVRVEFPHVDLNDQVDFVSIEIPEIDRNPNEPDNQLLMSFDTFSDPIQAEYLGMIELKQSRLDKIVTFRTDYVAFGLNAGDIIDVTAAQYGWTQKLFRIVSISENDEDDGSISLGITALEYDANIYSTDDLIRYERSSSNGIRTLGAINTPETPVVNFFTQLAKPYVRVYSIVPEGVVNSMDLFLSSDSVNFNFVGSVYPDSGGAFAPGTNVQFDYDGIRSGTVYAKVRASNSQASSLFSPIGSASINLTQVTDAIGNNTSILNNSGLPISLLLALPKLLSALDGFLGGNESAFGSVAKNNYASLQVTGANCLTKLNAMTAGYTQSDGYLPANQYNRSNWIAVSTTVGSGINILELDIKTPLLRYSYEFQDRTGTIRTQVAIAQPPLNVSVYYGANLATATSVATTTIDWNANYNKVIINAPTAGTYWIAGFAIPTYDLDMYWSRTGLTAGDYNTVWPISFTDQFGNFDVLVNAIKLG